MKKLSRIQSGVTGVYAVAYELSKRGYLTSTTFRNTKGVDIFASNENLTKTISIQVKTIQGKQGNQLWFTLGEKDEKYSDYYYVFVNLNHGEKPDFFIVPSKTVALDIAERHKKWLASSGKRGPRKDSSMRAYYPTEQDLNRWEILGLD